MLVEVLYTTAPVLCLSILVTTSVSVHIAQAMHSWWQAEKHVHACMLAERVVQHHLQIKAVCMRAYMEAGVKTGQWTIECIVRKLQPTPLHATTHE